MLEIGGAHPTAAMASLNSFVTTTNAATVKKRKKSTAQPNPKKMFEEVGYCFVLLKYGKIQLISLPLIYGETFLHLNKCLLSQLKSLLIFPYNSKLCMLVLSLCYLSIKK